MRNSSAGIALVSVLWLLMLLSGLAATVAYITRVQAILARHSFDFARAQAAADAAIVNTIAGLSDAQPDRRPASGAPQSWEFEGLPITIVVTREAGRIDVNKAHDDLLLAFFQVEGVTASAAANLLDQLRSRQTGGMSLRHMTGANQLTSPLETLEEVRQIPEWQGQHLDCWLSSLTVYSGQSEVDVSAATPAALAALQWLQAHDPKRAKSPTATPGADTPSGPLLGEVVRIRALATGTEVFAISEWVGRLTGDRSTPMLTMRWDHGIPTEPATSCTPDTSAEPLDQPAPK